jgi:hypothetical protein
MKQIAAAVLSLGLFSANAENLMGIRYMDTLAQVKARYPNANFTALKPAWLQPTAAFIEVSGMGMNGSLRIAFSDPRPLFRQMVADNAADPTFDPQGAYKRLMVQADDDALAVEWVRWVPSGPIPIERYTLRYGSPACKFDDTMQPVCEWPAVQIEAQMSDNHKLVYFVTSSFTKAEKAEAWKRLYKIEPK